MKKNGFTLIELLAVILILGIIALIAIPVVSNIITDSKKGALKSSVQNIVTAIEQQCQLEQMKNEKHTTGYIFLEGNISPKLNVKGSLPRSGTIEVSDDCKVTSANVSSEKFAAVLDNDDIKISNRVLSYNKYVDGTVIYFNPETGLVCDNYVEDNSLINNKNGCMKWYAFNDSQDNGYINMILDHNTTNIVAWNSTLSSTEMKEVAEALVSDTAKWKSELNSRLISANDIAKITKNKNFNVTDSESYFYFDSNTADQSSTCKSGNLTGCNYGWLYDRTDIACTDYGCLNNSNIESWGYWTESINEPGFVWSVLEDGCLDHIRVDNLSGVGVRPVITVSKIKII